MRRSTLLACVILLSGCPKKNEGAAQEDLLPQVKSGLADRDARLTSFLIEGSVQQPAPSGGPDGGPLLSEAKFEVAHRAPNKLRGTVQAGAQAFTYVFDGERMAQVDPASRKVVEYELNAPKDEVAFFIAQIFGTLVPEGYRAPVLDFKAASVKRVSHPKAVDAVELSSVTRGENDHTVQVAYVLRWPSLDLLEKRMSAGGGTMRLSMVEEHCDPKLKLCVPKKLEQRFDGQLGATTTVTRVELNNAPAADAFAVTVPEGFTLEKRPLSAAGR